ncbi:MAG: hypothetical protein PHT69_13875 [Bacteroidales bacterium]|nr:hypothetical protein [Bacteroidales bacterium]
MRIVAFYVFFYFLLLFQSFDITAQTEIDTEENEEGTEIQLITEYEIYNKMLGGDSIRLCNGLPCNAWVKDLYPNGNMKHRGYYLDGQLASVYKNYYENQQLERDYVVKSHRKSVMMIYYPTGQLLSEIEYDYSDPVSWKDFYPDGQLEYSELHHSSKEYILHRLFYYPDGKPQSSTELINRKKLLYNKVEYYENGQVKEKGLLSFNKSLGDYQRTGIWQFFDERGNLILEETYYKNRVINDSENIENSEDEENEEEE